MQIAISNARTARAAREAALAQPDRKFGAQLRTEFEASLAAVAAAAHALDALYGSTVVPQAIREQWIEKGTKRHGKIREALKQLFDTGPVNARWVTEFGWLFDLRDAAAHAEESPKEPVPHPLGTNTAPELVHYSAEAAAKAVTLALSVLRWCVDHPRPALQDVVAWSTANEATIARLEQEWMAEP